MSAACAGAHPRAVDLPYPGLYARAWRHAIGGGVVRWRWAQDDGVEKFQQALHARINARGGLPVHVASWRKLDAGWYWWARRLADTVNGTRIIVRPPDVPLELRERLKNRITWPWEE